VRLQKTNWKQTGQAVGANCKEKIVSEEKKKNSKGIQKTAGELEQEGKRRQKSRKEFLPPNER